MEVQMTDAPDKGDSKKFDRRKSRSGEDRRVYPRYDFFAQCELTIQSSGARYEARVTQIALGSCFVDLPVVLPQGTDVTVRIIKEGRPFEATGRATYHYPSLGIGIAFTSLSAENQQTLDGWIKKVAG
ncbi:MAG: PilZ domain-containing protein [Candidatus Acidiferrales bacterium]